LKVRTICAVALAATLIGLALDPAFARPFALPGGEAGGAPTGFGGWLLGVAAWLNHLMAGEVKALHGDASAIWPLLGLSLAYGVFHAAGPGHGKALIASYIFANEQALRRGVVMSFLAAILQALVAIALIGVAALIFHATEMGLNRTSNVVEVASYLFVAGIGAWLVWTKGLRFYRALRLVIAERCRRRLSVSRRGAGRRHRRRGRLRP
jgi:nickel/cobalt transporter (NicO) family protein